MYRAGTITLVAPSLGMALAVSGANKWFVPQNRRGQFTPGTVQPELTELAAEMKLLPAMNEIVYFIPDESDSSVKLWATKQEYDYAQALIRQANELKAQQEERRKEMERQRKELIARPRIRVMELFTERKLVNDVLTEIQADPTKIMEMLREDFLRQHPIVYPRDRYTTSEDIRQKRERWFEQLTPEGWVRISDPRRKS